MHPDETVIHDYVDDVLGEDERNDVHRHLDACVVCRGLADDLVELKRAVGALGPIEPPARVWSQLQQAVREQGAPPASMTSMASMTSIAWLAAAAVIVLAAAIGFMFRRPPASTAPAASEAARSVEAELRQAEEHYEKAIKGLEQMASDQRGSLDPKTADTLQKNLAVIDQAISESREAVRAQPNSERAEQSLLDNFKTKVSVLQDTVALINEMRKGNEIGAARMVSGLNQKGS